jgi:DNA-binding MarR family transcriptional regulator
MSIEKDIQQQAFRNDYQKAAVNIIFSANWLNERMKNFFDVEDITPQQYNILRILRGSKQPMSDTSRIVERLLKKGLVEKKVCPADKRLVDVVISKKGLALLEKLDHKNSELDSMIQGLSAEEAITLNTLLDKMREQG